MPTEGLDTEQGAGTAAAEGGAAQYQSPFKKRYDNFIGGEFRAPKAGRYFENVSPVTGRPICEVARSDASDVDAALDAAHAAKDAWGRASVTDRSNALMKIAQVVEDNLELLATCETWDNGKAIRETMAAALPLAGSSRLRSPPATASCSSRPNRHRRRSWSSASSSPICCRRAS